MKTCFIIMPITTSPTYIDKYRGDKDHFQHVLDFLFRPAIEKAGLQPILPISKGSDIIHAEIIKNLEESDLVFCDMSILNPNVFFELGIRTAINKPVCLVKDELTTSVPFDTAIINNEHYCSSLDPWILSTEIEKLTKHIEISLEKSAGVNSLWKYFSMSLKAHIPKDKHSEAGQLDYLTLQVEALRKKIENGNSIAEIKEHSDYHDIIIKLLHPYLLSASYSSGAGVMNVLSRKIPLDTLAKAHKIAREADIKLLIDERE